MKKIRLITFFLCCITVASAKNPVEVSRDKFFTQIDSMLSKAVQTHDVPLFARAVLLGGGVFDYRYGDSVFASFAGELEREIEQTSDIVQKAVCRSVLAEVKIRLVQSGWYGLVEKDSGDIKNSEWFRQTTSALSLLETSLFGRESLPDVSKQDSVLFRGYYHVAGASCPTWFDLLTHRAINIYMMVPFRFYRDCECRQVNANLFSTKGNIDLFNADEFMKDKFIKTDLTGGFSFLPNKAVLLYQQLLKFHKSDSNCFVYWENEYQFLCFLWDYVYMFGEPNEKFLLFYQSKALLLNHWMQDAKITWRTMNMVKSISNNPYKNIFLDDLEGTCLINRTSNISGEDRQLFKYLRKELLAEPELSILSSNKILYPGKAHTFKLEYCKIKKLKMRINRIVCSSYEYRTRQNKINEWPRELVCIDSLRLGYSYSYKKKQAEWVMLPLKSGIYEISISADYDFSRPIVTLTRHVSDVCAVGMDLPGQSRVLVDTETGLCRFDEKFIRKEQSNNEILELSNNKGLWNEVVSEGVSSFPLRYTKCLDDDMELYQSPEVVQDTGKSAKGKDSPFKMEILPVKKGVCFNVPVSIGGRITSEKKQDGLSGLTVRYKMSGDYVHPVLYYQGETKADENGNFTVTVIPPSVRFENVNTSLSKYYQITAEAELPSGEKISATSHLTAGMKTVYPRIKVFSESEDAVSMDINRVKQFSIDMENYEDGNVSGTYKYELFSLSKPGNPIMEKELETLPEKDLVKKGTFVAGDTLAEILQKLPIGGYRLKISSMDSLFNVPAESAKSFMLYDTDYLWQFPVPLTCWVPQKRCLGTKKKTADLLVGTSEQELNVLIELYCENEPSAYRREWLQVKNECKSYQVDYNHVKSKGKLYVYITAVKNGRVAHSVVPVIRVEEQ